MGATEKQKKVAQELIKNLQSDKPLNRSKLLEKVGYARSTARHKTPYIIESKAVQDLVRPVIERMEIERNRALEILPKKIGRASYGDAIQAVDKLTKNIQLLSGGDTERINQPQPILYAVCSHNSNEEDTETE